MLRTQLCSVRYTTIQAKKSVKSICAVHPDLTENTENSLVKHVPHISIHESHNASILAISNSFHSTISKEWYEKCLCNPYVTYCSSLACDSLSWIFIYKIWPVVGSVRVPRYSLCYVNNCVYSMYCISING